MYLVMFFNFGQLKLCITYMHFHTHAIPHSRRFCEVPVKVGATSGLDMDHVQTESQKQDPFSDFPNLGTSDLYLNEN